MTFIQHQSKHEKICIYYTPVKTQIKEKVKCQIKIHYLFTLWQTRGIIFANVIKSSQSVMSSLDDKPTT